MTNTNISNFRKNIYALIDQTIKFNEPINVMTKSGEAVVLSKEEYDGMIASLFLSSLPATKKEILAVKTMKKEDLIDEKDFW